MPGSRLWSLFILTVLLGTARGALAADWTQGGYADRTSVVQGGTIKFSIATSVAPFTLTIVNLARPNQVLTTITGLTAPPRDCTGLWAAGCGWPVTTTLSIPSNWPSGYYAARFPVSGGGTRHVIFVVKAAVPGSSSPMVIVSTTNTYTAYNPFGGKSVYDFNSTNGVRAPTVSFARPYDDGAGLGRFPAWEQQFLDWLTAEGRSYEVITDDDLESSSALAGYKVVVLVGHSEYWTLPARNRVESFVAAGGHLAVFSGNTMWWQARINLAARQFTCYKNAATDPMAGVNDAVVTTNFFARPVYNPENTILGVSFRHAEYANLVAPGDYELAPVAQRTPYTVRDAASWVFDGTGVVAGQKIAQATGGFEVDGATFNTTAGGAWQVDGSDGTPLNFQILATLPAELGYGVIGLYTSPSGGTVFNAATQSWSHGLASDAIVQQMTRNVLNRFSTGAPFPYVRVETPYLSEDLFNTPSPVPGALPNWDGALDDAVLSARCAYEGALGLELKGTEWLELRRDFSPFNTGRSAVEASFAVNLDFLQQTASWPVPLVQLMGRGTGAIVYGVVEVQIRPQGKSIRLSTFRADGSTTSSTAWKVLSPGWHTVRAFWRSPGAVALQVDAQPAVEAFNAETGQTVHDVYLAFPGTADDAVGSICIDALRLINGGCDPAAVTGQPQSKTIAAGSSTTLSVTAAGTGPLSYQWYAGTTAINGATGSSVTVSPATTTSYFVRVTNGCGTSDSATATVTVCTPASVTTDPQSKTITSGTSTTLSAAASGTTPLSYQWFAGTTAINGATGSSVTVSPTTTTTYFVRVTNSCGTDDSATATVTVCTPASVTTDPQSKTITSGSSTTLSVTASGTSPLSYQWFAGTTAINGATSDSVTVSPTTTTTYFVRVSNSCGTDDSATATVTVCNPATITTEPQSKTITSGASTTLSVVASGTTLLSYQWFAGTIAISGATSDSVTVSPTTTTTYFVRVTNSCGTDDSAPATVTVCNPATITADPQSITITSGASTTLRATASGTTPLSYQWFAGTTAINGATSDSVTVSPTTTTTYFVRVTNSCGTDDSAPATVTVCNPATITTEPQSKTINSGSSTTLSVVASGTAPLSYQWFAGTTAINGATSDSVTVSPTATTTYFVRVSNSCGTDDSAPATVTVCNPATITTEPQSKTISSGSSTTLSVAASGTTLSYQWFAGTTAINGATSSSLTVSPTTTTTYFVRVSNSCGTDDSAPATVTVCNPAAITTHPQSTTIASGSSTTLRVAASGTAPLSYQWFAGTTAINGATNDSVTVSPTTTTTYYVRVTNGCGTVNSATATVTVTVAAPEGASSLYVVTPCRLLDTRNPAGPRGGPAISGSQTRSVQVTGVCGIPAGAKAVVANVTAVLPAGQGFLVLYAAGTALPGTSNLSYRPAKTRANSSIVALSPNGALQVYNDGSSTVHFIIDVTGYFQ